MSGHATSGDAVTLGRVSEDDLAVSDYVTLFGSLKAKEGKDY